MAVALLTMAWSHSPSDGHREHAQGKGELEFFNVSEQSGHLDGTLKVSLISGRQRGLI